MKALWTRAAATIGGWKARYRSRELGPFEPTRWVWSRGLALSCDHNGGLLFVRGQRGGRAALRFDPRGVRARPRRRSGVDAADCAAAISARRPAAHQRRASRWSPATKTGRSPEASRIATKLLDSPQLVYWFRQNLRRPERVIPSCRGCRSGVDFHTISNGPRWGHAQATPAEQEAELDAAAQRDAAERRTAAEARTPTFTSTSTSSKAWSDDRDSVQRALERQPERGLPAAEAASVSSSGARRHATRSWSVRMATASIATAPGSRWCSATS